MTLTTNFKITVGIACIIGSFLPFVIQAASPTYKGKVITAIPKEIILKPGEKKTFEIKLQNTGTAIWVNSGENYVSIATVTLPKTGDPILKRDSALKDESWVEEFRPARISEKSVAPQKTSTFKFTVKAPQKVGEYTQTLAAVARRISWIEGSTINLKIKVAVPPPVAEKSIETTIPTSYPVRDKTYAAQKLIQSDQEVELIVGEVREFTVGFKNVGQKVWNKRGTRAVSMYTVNPTYRASSFFASQDAGWLSESQVQLNEEEVKPGEIGYFKFRLKSPQKVGEYEEHFRLAVENSTWIQGGEVNLPITVRVKAVVVAPDTETNDPLKNPVSGISYRDKTLSALKLIQSASSIELKTGEASTFRVGFKNNGIKAWTNADDKFVSLYTASPNYRPSMFAPLLTENSGWMAANQIKMETATVNPGEIGYFAFSLRAPGQPGEYKEAFRLAAEEWSWVQGGDLEIALTVISEGSPTDGQSPSILGTKTVEPILRVGLFPTKEEVKVTASGPFAIKMGTTAQVLETLNSGQVATINFDFATKLYKLVTPTLALNTPDYIRFEPIDPSVIMEIMNYEKRPAWNLLINYNRFRGSIEARYSPAKDRFWMINELPMEHYLKGMAETSNGSPPEFLKSMAVAARTYAFYHYLRQTKHKSEFFMVDSYYDQVYRGYSLEQRLTDLTAAVDATRGVVVTYGNEIAITPYYSRSDGRTRNWNEVWNGDVAWLVSVPTPQDAGQTLWGHGVGMSARAALLMAKNEGQSMENIMKYFFRGVSLDKWY